MGGNFYMTGNDDKHSRKVKSAVEETAKKFGMTLVDNISEDCAFSVCVGGDGSFIHAIHDTHFPEVPFIGINTGHLGFYQELTPDLIEEFFISYKEGRYRIENLAVVESLVETPTLSEKILGINEIAIKGENFRTVHLEVYIDKNFLENFFGDGIVISSPVGSTAYTYALGGAIIHPSLNTLELSPISPITNRIYRSLVNSIVVPGNLPITLVPEKKPRYPIKIIIDGKLHPFQNILKIESRISEKTIKKLSLSTKSYWRNLRDKIL